MQVLERDRESIKCGENSTAYINEMNGKNGKRGDSKTILELISLPGLKSCQSVEMKSCPCTLL